MVLVERSSRIRGGIVFLIAFIVFGLFCEAGYQVNKEPFPQVRVNGVPYEGLNER